MIKILLVTLFVISYPQVLFADCYVDYKAKKNEPLRLHYGIARIDTSVCKDRDAAVLDLRARLQTNGWKMLPDIRTGTVELCFTPKTRVPCQKNKIGLFR